MKEGIWVPSVGHYHPKLNLQVELRAFSSPLSLHFSHWLSNEKTLAAEPPENYSDDHNWSERQTEALWSGHLWLCMHEHISCTPAAS